MLLSSRPVRILSVASLAFALAACGGGDAKKTSGSSSAKAKGGSDKPVPTSNPGGTTAANTTTPPGPGTANVAAGGGLGVPVWWGGAKYSLGAMKFDAPEQTLTVEVDVDNLLKSNQTPQPTVILEADGSVLSHGGLNEYKEILAKSKVKNTLKFNNLATFDPAKTTLVFGDGSESQVRIPLSGKGPNITDEPVKQAFTGDIVIGPATFTVQSVEVRWDWYPHDAQNVKIDKAALLLFGKLKAPADKEIYCTQEKFEITQPDGTKITADNIGPDAHVAQTKTLEDFYVLFTIDAKGRKYAGDYSLVVTQPWGADGADVASSPTKLTLK